MSLLDDDPQIAPVGKRKSSHPEDLHELMDKYSFDWNVPLVEQESCQDVATTDRFPTERRPPAGHGKLQAQTSKEDLVRLYQGEGFSLEDIAKKFGVTRQAVQHLLKVYGIEARDKSKARVLALSKGQFSGKWFCMEYGATMFKGAVLRGARE